MKKITILLLNVFIWIFSYAQPLTPDEKLLLDKLDQEYSADEKKVSLNYAWLLYRSGNEASYSKADTILSKTILMQDHDPESLTYGQWGWTLRDGEKFADWNNALFQAHVMFCGLWNEQHKMSPEIQSDFVSSCNRLVEAAKRRWDYEVFDIYRDFTAYSNVFAMYVQTFMLAADRLNNALLKKLARTQWTRWYNHISFFGIDEFASPGYNHVVFKALADIHNHCRDKRIEQETKEIMDHLYLLQSVLTHPSLKLPVTGVSRDYRNFIEPGDARSGILSQTLPEGYLPPKETVEVNRNRRYPFEVIGKASIMPFIFKSYQLEDAAMGSMTGGACFQQQVHCIATVGKNENERAVAFLQGSYTPVNGYTDQVGTSTLCVYNRLPTYWHLTQKHGVVDMSKYKETFGDFGMGVSKGWKEKLKTPEHIILEAYGYDLHIFPFVVENGCIIPCDMKLKHRTTTSPRYHPRPRIFDEYVFPEEPDWFGAYVTLAESGIEVENPAIRFKMEDKIMTFTTREGHQLRLFIAEKGDTRQLFNVDPALIPLLKITTD